MLSCGAWLTLPLPLYSYIILKVPTLLKCQMIVNTIQGKTTILLEHFPGSYLAISLSLSLSLRFNDHFQGESGLAGVY